MPTANPKSSSGVSVAQKATSKEIFDIREASKYLGISPETLHKYASEGFVPGFKLGNRWRFKRSRLDQWADQAKERSNTISRKRSAERQITTKSFGWPGASLGLPRTNSSGLIRAV